MKKVLISNLCFILFLSACGKKVEPVIIIVPDNCQINAGEEFPISLEGSNMPSSSEIKWSATKGEIIPSAGVNVIYTAPQDTGSVIITAVLETDNERYSKTLVCEITANDPIPTESDAINENQTSTPENENKTIAITEVMAAPCDGVIGPGKNEYIELYNYGSTEIDVNGWWLVTGPSGKSGPDEITTWATVNPGVSLGSHVVTNSSIIPPSRFAILISPRYHTGTGKYLMPYIFPKDTIILSLVNSNYLGDDSTGLYGNAQPIHVLSLYIGSETLMETVVSTYGAPIYGSSPSNVIDNGADNFPFPVPDCHSVERIIASGSDTVNNWREIDEGTPGTGAYVP